MQRRSFLGHGLGHCAGALGMALLAVPVLAGLAWALLPPEHYAELARNSKVKAIASIESVDTLEVGEHFSRKQVNFRLEYAISPGVPPEFSGTCRSLDSEAQRYNALEAGYIYLYPKPGLRVFVTIAELGGEITGLTVLTPELEEALKNAPERIRYRVGDVVVE